MFPIALSNLYLASFEKDLSELPKLKDKLIVKKYLASDITLSATYVSTLGNIKTLFYQAPEVDRFLDSRMNSDLTYTTDIVSDVSFAASKSHLSTSAALHQCTDLVKTVIATSFSSKAAFFM